MRSLCCAITLALLSLSAIAEPFYADAKKCKVEVLAHSFPQWFDVGKFEVTAKIKNAGNLPLRGALKVVVSDKKGKEERVVGKADIDMPPSSVSDSEIELKIKEALAAADLKRPIRILFETSYGEAVCYEGVVGEKAAAKPKRRKRADKGDAAITKKWPKIKYPAPGVAVKHDIKFIKSLPAGEGAKWKKFIDEGGVLIVPLIDSKEDFAGVVEFCDESYMPSFYETKKRERNVYAGGTPLFDWPNSISPALLQINKCRLAPPKMKDRSPTPWEVIQGGYTIMMRIGYGLLILSTHTCADTPELRENILTQLELENNGMRFVSFGHAYNEVEEYMGDSSSPTVFGGTTSLKLRNNNYATTNLNLALRMVFSSKADKRLSRTFVERRKVSRTIGDGVAFTVKVPAFSPELEGEWKVRTELFEWNGKGCWLIDERDCLFPELIEVLPPDYRATVSTERRESEVYIGLRVNRAGIDMGGMKWKLAAKDASGKVVAKAEGVFGAGERFAEAKLPFTKDAPAGAYALEAEVETPCSGIKTAKSEFYIVAPEKGQIIVDQDGFFLNEGKPYFPMGSYHCTRTQWTNVIDETGLCARDMGFNWMQIWESNWFYNYTLDRKCLALNIDKSLTGEAREKAIDCWIETNKLNRAAIKDVVLCLEGFALWGSVLFERPGEVGLYRFEREQEWPDRVRTIVEDPDQLVRMWYCADEANGNYYKGLKRAADWVRKYDPKYHPVFNLGNLPAVMAGDWGGNDIYLRYYGGVKSGREFAQRVAGMRRQFAKYRRRPFIVPQAFGLSPRQPTETKEWVRLESYASIIHGANGLGFYCWKQTGTPADLAQGMGWNPPTAHAVKKIISEIKVLHPALRVPGQRNIVSLDGNVDALLCGDESSGRYLISVNLFEGAVDTMLPVPGLADMKLEPMFDSPKAQMAKGVYGAEQAGLLSVKLPQWGTGVWKILKR